MRLQLLKLKNFKNYVSCSLNLNPRFNYIYGDNGNGKTNILEAISFICYTRSFLQNPESECVRYNEVNFEIYSELFSSANTKNTVLFSFDKSNLKKEIVFNNDPVLKFSGFFGTLPLIVLSPGDLKLTAGTPGDRRRNFDILISQVSKVYFNDLKSLSKIIRQKNSLLKNNLISRKYNDSRFIELLEVWNEKLVNISVRIILKRIEFIREFAVYLKSSFMKIAGDSIIPQIEYCTDSVENLKENELNEDNINLCIKNALMQKMKIEQIRGISLVGPHRDNYFFSMIKNGNKFDVRSFASHGEHKAFIVSLKISEYQFLKDKLYDSNTGEPIILLDDLFSELDATRTEKIASMLTELNQVFLTTTDKRYIDISSNYFKKEDISSFYIDNGTAQKIA